MRFPPGVSGGTVREGRTAANRQSNDRRSSPVVPSPRARLGSAACQRLHRSAAPRVYLYNGTQQDSTGPLVVVQYKGIHRRRVCIIL